MRVREIFCKTAISRCGFPGGGWAINPYVGCSHGCLYCYARFIKRFTGHKEKWGTFVDVRVNIKEVLKRQVRSKKYCEGQIYIGTVTDPYQPLEEKYKVTREVLEVLVNYPYPISILTKSDMVLRDLDLIKEFKDIEVNFTINTLDEDWKSLVEPYSPPISNRLSAANILIKNGIKTYIMMGPYWPIFTNPEELFIEFKNIGISKIYTESFNTIGGNWTEVEKILQKRYPKILPLMKETFFNKIRFYEFYKEAEEILKELSERYDIEVETYF